MAPILQTTNISSSGRPDGTKGRIIMTGNSGRETGIRGYIYPGPQGRGIRAESIILKNHYQTTAKNPMETGTKIQTRTVKRRLI